MTRNFSGWGVTIAGLLLAVGGCIAMWSGWDMIVVERGWSLFIAGAVALSGGVVTIALGRVVVALSKLAILPTTVAAPMEETIAVAPPSTMTPAHAKEAPPAPVAAPSPVVQDIAPEPAIENQPPPPRRESPAPPPLRQRSGYSPSLPPLRRTPLERAPAAPEPKAAPKEVDRYTTGGATYVMLSDGSVEVHGPEGVRRYASLAELKAETAPPSR